MTIVTGAITGGAPARTGELLGNPANLSIWIGWHILSALCIPLLLSAIRIEIPFWEMSFGMHVFFAGLALTHLVAAFVLSGIAFRRGRIGFVAIFVSVAIAYAIFGGALVLTGSYHSRSILIMAAGASFVFASITLDLMGRLYKVLVPALLLGVAGMGTVAFAGWPDDDGVRPTAFYQVRLVESAGIPSEVRGGAVEPFGSGFLVASGDGGLFYVDDTSTPDSIARRLPSDLPLNRAVFQSESPGNAFGNDPFRVADILVQESADRFRLFVSHHYWKSDERCFVFRVSMTEGASAAFLAGTADVNWRAVYDSQPCLELGEIRFEQAGGRMVALDDDTLLVTVGDHSLDGFYAKANVPQDPASHYGKTVRIDLTGGTSQVHSLGHRNPQGLHRMPDGRIWLTEQGPAGGDELNLVLAGANYGWPNVTYGVAYDKHTWPLSALQGRHVGYVEPWFAWVPSIAVTSIIGVRGDLFPLWKGDLIVSSLKGNIIRLRLGDHGVRFAEPLYDTQTRIRDMIEAPDGRLVLLSDEGSVSFIERVEVEGEDPGEAAVPHDGEVLYRMCQDCHSIGSGSDHRSGPDLRGIVGRDVASAPRFEYSPALRSLSGDWTEERLHQFLANPEAYAPGTTMPTGGVGDPAARQLLIDYLKTRQ